MAGIYIHIPFCVQKCLYCDFPSYEGQSEYLPAYLDALYKEIKVRASEESWGVFHTVFIGGGTPSLLSGEEIQLLLDVLRAHFRIATDAEISMESNPGTLTLSNLLAYKAAGVNRLSVGIQSLEDCVLQKIGRIHNSRQAMEALELAKAAGFTNINADVMYGLPGQTELDFLSTLRDLMLLSPTHISAYSLITEEQTPLYAAVQNASITLPNEDEVAIMEEIGAAFLGTHHLQRYEISNYAQAGYECRHNLNYWHNGPYLGLGAGAHSAFALFHEGQSTWTRWENTSQLHDYIQTSHRSLKRKELKRISRQEEAFEFIMLGLRLTDGISLSAFSDRFSVSLSAFYPKAMEILTLTKLLEIEQNKARLTPRGLDLQNLVLQYFLEEKPY